MRESAHGKWVGYVGFVGTWVVGLQGVVLGNVGCVWLGVV